MSKLKESLESGLHHQLNKMAGTWKGITKVWFEPGDPVDVSEQQGAIHPLFDGRFLLHEYKSSFGGKPIEGLAIIGYHLKTNQFQTAWVDTYHMGTGIMLSEGERGSKLFRALGSYEAAADDPTTWGWRTTFDLENPDWLVIRMYNIFPDGMEALAVETVYERVKVVFD